MNRSLRLGSALLFLASISSSFAADAPLDIYFIDVDGGAATLIVTPERESILIDSGWPGKEDRDPIRIEHVLKDVAKLDHLDHLVTTHWHMDHFGGVEGLSKRVRIDHYWDRGLPDLSAAGGDKDRFPDGPSADDPLGIAYRKASAGKRRSLKPGDRLPFKGEVVSSVLAAGGSIYEPGDGKKIRNPLCESAPPDQPADASDNARSIVLHFRLGNFQFLDCGDMTWNVEKKLVCPYDLIGQVDLFQVTHHGMDISNHPTLVKTIQPTIAIMDNGPHKGGSAATVRLLKSIPSIEALYALHKNVATGPDDNATPALTANRPGTDGQFIHASVAPDGKTFSVRIGSDGQAKEFAVR